MSRSIRFKWLLLPLLCTSLAASGEQPPAPPPEPLPPMTVQTCLPCHGPAGISRRSAIPSLAGLPRVYLLKVLRAYRHGGRFGTVMGRLLQHASDEELTAMADYFSRQKPEIPKQRVKWELVSKGRQLHRIYCRSCHGDLDQAPDIGTPRLNGIWMDYLRWTLRDYVIGINQADNDMSQALIWVIRRHGDTGMEALVNYYGSARPDKAVPP